MERSERVFVDSNYFIAFFNTADGLHRDALAIGKKLKADKILLVVSNFIFLESVTVLSQKLGRQAATRVGRYLLENPAIEQLHIDETLQERSWEIFQEVQEKDIGFVDCSIVATMKSEEIQKLLTFDTTDFKKLQNKYRFSFYE